MKARNMIPRLILSALFFLLLTACGSGETAISVSLVNRTGQEISEIHITPATTTEWGDSLIEAPLSDQTIKSVALGSFTQEDLSAGFNILVYNADSEVLYTGDLDEQCFSLSDGDFLVFLPPESDTLLDITPEYDSASYDLYAGSNATGASSLLAQSGSETPEIDPTEFTGNWKYDALPSYLLLDDARQWCTLNLYTGQDGFGTVTPEADGLCLTKEDGTVLTTLQKDDSGCLIDADGNTLSPITDVILLPSGFDELTQTVSFSGDFSGAAIGYPTVMYPEDAPLLSGGLCFSPVMGPGTDDQYASILIGFHPISGYDDQMTQGYGAAKPAMTQMFSAVLTELYGDSALEIAAADCYEFEQYYSITGTMQLDGSVVSGELTDALSAAVELRYYGPTGYVMVAIAIAPESRIDIYRDTCWNMLASCTYSTDWITAPKPIPPQPAPAPDGSDAPEEPYYWYDEDGDIWYWNGSENEFIGFGSDYYIDDDGQYYESNDAGWEDDGDWDYYDAADPWSDPGDTWDDDYYDDHDYYDDYDDYDDYAYDDEGWGDYADDDWDY